jgi:hypothetical protein
MPKRLVIAPKESIDRSQTTALAALSVKKN